MDEDQNPTQGPTQEQNPEEDEAPVYHDIDKGKQDQGQEEEEEMA